MFDIRRHWKNFHVFSFPKKKWLKATDVWFQDMLEIDLNYSILDHIRLNYKICFVFDGVDKTGDFYKSCDQVVPLK